jgi:hypothetical protein
MTRLRLDPARKASRKVAGWLVLFVCACSLGGADGMRSHSLPPGVLKALAEDELQYCKQVSGGSENNCHPKFVANLRWRELKIAPSGRIAILVENRNQGFCGTAGCALHLFLRDPDGQYEMVLDEVGVLRSVQVLKRVTKGNYDILKTGTHREEKTIYRWDGSTYIAAQ